MAKAKGTTLLGAVKFLRSRPEEARRVLSEDLHRYLEERVSTAAWYPEEDLLHLIRATLELLPGPRQETLEMMGSTTARTHQEGVYSHLMKDGPTRSSSFALWSSQHDTGRMEVTREGPRVSRVDLIDYALPSPEMCVILGAYVAESMRMAGLETTVEKTACRLDGDDLCSWRCVGTHEQSE